MKKNKSSIRLKAGFLLTVFALNTLIGFACAVGVDFSFKNKIVEETPVIKVHTHADGKKHVHHKSPVKKASEKKEASEKTKEECCTDKVVELSQVEKFLSKRNSLDPFFTFIVSNPQFILNSSYNSQVSLNTHYFVRSYHPPIPDIRIAIQSFLI